MNSPYKTILKSIFLKTYSFEYCLFLTTEFKKYLHIRDFYALEVYRLMSKYVTNYLNVNNDFKRPYLISRYFYFKIYKKSPN
ncbi:MAG: class I adenylate cyclase [Arsenophonus sp. ET-LJ4-MAG3]